MKFLSECEDNISSLKVHEWLAITLVTGIIGGLACLTSFNSRGEAGKSDSAWVASQSSGFDVTIKGAVDHPGVYHLKSEMKMKDLLAIAGITANADLRRFSLEGMIKKGRIINVPSRAMINVHLKGAVINDQILTLPKNSKLEDLIGMGEFAKDADLAFLKKKRRLKADEVIIVPSKTR